MTESEAIKAVCDVAYSQVGYREGENNWNKYAKELDPLNITYGPKQNQPWCGEFKLWCYYKAFGVDKALKMLCSPKPTGIPLCRTGAKYFKDAGRWSTKPQRGACVFFYYDGDINHTGIVVEATSLSITTVEGNSSDMVSRRVYPVGDERIAGYGIPDWSVVTGNEPAPTPEPEPTPEPIPVVGPGEYSLRFHYLSKGAGMDDLSYLKPEVRAVQQLLISNGYTCGGYGADGEFGSGTEQSVLNFQYNNSLDPDGVVGPLTKAKLEGVSAS